MASGKRGINESFAAYRKRLNNQERVLKIIKKGRLVWDSVNLGTFFRQDVVRAAVLQASKR